MNQIKWLSEENLKAIEAEEDDNTIRGLVGETSQDKYFGCVYITEDELGFTNNSDTEDGNFGGGIDYYDDEIPEEILKQMKEKQQKISE